MISFNKTPLQLWNGKQLLIREGCARRAYCGTTVSAVALDRYEWRNCLIRTGASSRVTPMFRHFLLVYTHPRNALSTNRNSETVWGIHECLMKTMASYAKGLLHGVMVTLLAPCINCPLHIGTFFGRSKKYGTKFFKWFKNQHSKLQGGGSKKR